MSLSAKLLSGEVSFETVFGRPLVDDEFTRFFDITRTSNEFDYGYKGADLAMSHALQLEGVATSSDDYGLRSVKVGQPLVFDHDLVSFDGGLFLGYTNTLRLLEKVRGYTIPRLPYHYKPQRVMRTNHATLVGQKIDLGKMRQTNHLLPGVLDALARLKQEDLIDKYVGNIAVYCVYRNDPEHSEFLTRVDSNTAAFEENQARKSGLTA